MTAPDPRSLHDALANLLLSTARLHPDDIPAAAIHGGAAIGLGDVVIYLADLEQRVLLPLLGEGVVAEPLAIDGTMAGRAFRLERPQLGEPGGAGTPVWLPLLDSAERLGVLGATATRDIDEHARSDFNAFAALVAEILANKRAYGDVIAKSRRTRPLTLSAELRWAMLPPLTYTGRNVTISGVLEPAYEIAGDTFDYSVNGDVAHVAILDAVGHGLEAARIANLAVIAYRHGRRHGADAAGLYRAMDEAIVDQFGSEKFATAQLAELRLSTGRLTWINAGHPAPMVIRQGSRIDLACEATLPVGTGLATEDPPIASTDLEPGDLVLFLTDGVIEARSEDGEEFGRDRLGDLLQRAAAAGQTPAETVRRLAHAVLDHQEGVLQDDGTLLLLAWHGPPAPLHP